MNTIERYTLELIGEDPDNPDVFTDDADGLKPIRDSVNDAIEEIAMLTACTKKEYYLSLREDVNFYSLDFTDGSFAWVTDVWIVSQKRRLKQTDLIRLNQLNHRWLFDTGPPQEYFQIGLDYLGVWPCAASDTDILEITAVVIPARYGFDENQFSASSDYIATYQWEFGSSDSADGIRLRKNWDRAAAHYAAGEYFASRGDAKTAIYHHNTYLKKMNVSAKYPYAKEYIPKFRGPYVAGQ